MMNGPDNQSGPKSDACFTTTHWNAVLVREEIAHTVPTVAEIDEELRYLVWVLRG